MARGVNKFFVALTAVLALGVGAFASGAPIPGFTHAQAPLTKVNSSTVGIRASSSAQSGYMSAAQASDLAFVLAGGGGTSFTPQAPLFLSTADVLYMPAADATHDGYLSALNFVLFSDGLGGAGGGIPSGGTSTVDPSALGSGLDLWLKADAGLFSDTGCSVVATSSGNVACWADQSGHALNFVNAGGATVTPRMIYQGQAQHPSVFFGKNQSLTRPSDAGLTETSLTVCAVAQSLLDQNTQTIFSVGTTYLVGLGDSTPNGRAKFYTSPPGTDVNGYGVFTGRPVLICGTYQSGSGTRQLVIDGALVATDTGVGALDYSGGPIPVVGALNGIGQQFLGSIYEVLVYPNVLNASDFANLALYARQRWNAGDYWTGTSGSGGGGMSDPYVGNGWTPGSGTATVNAPGGLVVNGDATADAFITTGAVTTAQVNSPLIAPTGSQTVTITPSSTKGVRIHTTGSKETCNAGNAGDLFYQANGAGVADALYLCRKSSSDLYGWQQIN